MKVKDSHLYGGDLEITVGALLALTHEDKEEVVIDGDGMRVKDAYHRHDCLTVEEWGLEGYLDFNGFMRPRMWIATKEAKAARKMLAEEGLPKPVAVSAKMFGDMCVNAERYAIGRGNHVSCDCAALIRDHVEELTDAAKYVIARDIKCERQTCERCARISGEPSKWTGEWAAAWDELFDALGQDVSEDYS